MSASRTMLYFLGIVLVVIAIAVFFFTVGLSRWIPVSMFATGLLLIIGLSVMGFPETSSEST